MTVVRLWLIESQSRPEFVHFPCSASNGSSSSRAIQGVESCRCLRAPNHHTTKSQDDTDRSKDQDRPERHVLHPVALVSPHLVPAAGLLIVHVEFKFPQSWPKAREAAKGTHVIALTEKLRVR